MVSKRLEKLEQQYAKKQKQANAIGKEMSELLDRMGVIREIKYSNPSYIGKCFKNTLFQRRHPKGTSSVFYFRIEKYEHRQYIGTVIGLEDEYYDSQHHRVSVSIAYDVEKSPDEVLEQSEYEYGWKETSSEKFNELLAKIEATAKTPF